MNLPWNHTFLSLHLSATFTIRLPSDSTSRWTSLPSANTFYCRGRSGLSPPSCCPCRAHQSYNKRPEMDSLFGIQCTCTCHLLRARLATAEEVTARRNLAFTPLRLPWQPRILRLQYQNRWHRNAENHYHQAYTEGFAVFIFVSSRQTHGKYRSLIILLPSS